MRATLDSSLRVELDMAAVGEYAVGFRREKATGFVGSVALRTDSPFDIYGRVERAIRADCALVVRPRLFVVLIGLVSNQRSGQGLPVCW